MSKFITIVSLFFLYACGGAIEGPSTETEVSPLETAPFCDSAGWTIHAVQPGQCMVAWSKGNNVPTWQESLAADCQAVRVCGLERAQNVHVDSTPYDYGCNHFAQTGHVVLATTDVVEVAIRIDDESLGFVEFYDIGTPECDLVEQTVTKGGRNGHSDGY